MSQNDLVIANAAGAAVRADINSALKAIAELQSGASAPGTTYAYMWLEAEGVRGTTGAYTVDLADHGKVINITADTNDLVLTAAATLGDGFWFDVVNSGGNKRTVNPDGAETIDGKASISLAPSEGYRIHCDGSKFYTTGRSKIVAISSTETSAVATGTTTIPSDDTIPQNTEGDEYLTLSHVPKDTAHKLRVDISLYISHSAALPMITFALFKDSDSDALAVSASRPTTATHPVTITFNFVMTAGTLASTTFKVRAGAQVAGTTTLNGFSGSRQYGGKAVSSIRITEYIEGS